MGAQESPRPLVEALSGSDLVEAARARTVARLVDELARWRDVARRSADVAQQALELVDRVRTDPAALDVAVKLGREIAGHEATRAELAETAAARDRALTQRDELYDAAQTSWATIADLNGALAKSDRIKAVLAGEVGSAETRLNWATAATREAIRETAEAVARAERVEDLVGRLIYEGGRLVERTPARSAVRRRWRAIVADWHEHVAELVGEPQEGQP